MVFTLLDMSISQLTTARSDQPLTLLDRTLEELRVHADELHRLAAQVCEQSRRGRSKARDDHGAHRRPVARTDRRRPV
jgi:hypothetical protein